MAPSLVAFPFLLACATSVVLATWVARHRTGRASSAFAAMMAVAAVWAFCWTMMAVVPDAPTKVLFAHLKVGVVAFVPSATLALADALTGHRRRWTWPLELVLVTVTPVLAVTSPFHHLLFATATPDPNTGLVVTTAGPWLPIHTGLAYVVMGLAAVRVTRATAGMAAPLARQRLLIMLGVIPAALADIVFVITGVATLPGYSLSPAMINLGGVLFAWAIVRHGALEQDPLARFGVVDLIDDVMLIVDGHGVLVDMNRAGREHFVPGTSDLLGRPARTLFPGMSALLDAATRGLAAVEDVEVPADGGPRTYDVRISALDRNALAAGGFALVFRDATDRRRREDAIRQRAQELEEISRLKDGILATASHELRAPLGSMLGLTDALLDEPLAPGPLRYARSIRSSGDFLLSLVNGILDLAKIKAGRMELAREPFSVPRLLEGTRELYALACERKGLSFVTECPPGIPPLLGDHQRLGQILINLVGNALKFAAEGGITVRAAWADGHLMLEVADTGPGVAEADRERIFEEFGQAGTAESRRAGTGLGLAIVKRLVLLMGGAIEVRANVPRGSVFRLDVPLPAAPAEVRATPPLAPRPVPAARRRVLVMDDVPETELVVNAFVRGEPVDVVFVGDGVAGLEAFRTGTFDVVFADIEMPRLDGWSVVRELRTLEATEPRPRALVVALSAHEGPAFTQAALAAGFDLALTRPIRKRDFLAWVLGDTGPRRTTA